MVQIPTNNTILTVAIFQEYTTNYYFKNTGNSYYSATTLSTLPSIIKNVEVNLNAMLNGRLYKRYPPGDVQFNGYKNLTPQMEAETLYECLTECVEYRLITQQYVNLNNSYSGTVNGSNAYQTQNNNVIGLRQDITAKLTMLGLYANALIGDVKPKAVVDNPWEDNGKLINYANLQLWYSTFSQHDWSFSAPITFQNNITFLGDVNAMDFNANNIVANNINGTNGNFTNLNVTNLTATNGSGKLTFNETSIVTTLNGVSYTFPQTVFDLQTHYGLNLPDWSIIGEGLVNQDNNPPQNYTTLQLLGTWVVPNPKCSLTVNSSSSLKIYYYHIQVLNAYQGSILTNNTMPWLSYSSNGVFWIDIQKCFLYTHNNGVVDPTEWQGVNISTTINTTNTPDLDTSQWTNYQWSMDKCTFTINCIGGISTNNYATRDTRIVNPFPKGVGMEPNTVTVNNNSTVSWVVSMTPTCDTDTQKTGSDTFCSGSFSPWWIDSQNESLTQINTCLDIYFTIILLL